MSNDERVSRGTFHSMAVEKLKLESQLHSLTEENERYQDLVQFTHSKALTAIKAALKRAREAEQQLDEVLKQLQAEEERADEAEQRAANLSVENGKLKDAYSRLVGRLRMATPMSFLAVMEAEEALSPIDSPLGQGTEKE